MNAQHSKQIVRNGHAANFVGIANACQRVVSRFARKGYFLEGLSTAAPLDEITWGN